MCVSIWGLSGSILGLCRGIGRLGLPGVNVVTFRGSIWWTSTHLCCVQVALVTRQSKAPGPWNCGPGACCRTGLAGPIGGACGALSTPTNRQGIQVPVWCPQPPQSPPRKRRPVSLACHPTPGPLYLGQGPRMGLPGVDGALAVTCPTAAPASIVPLH